MICMGLYSSYMLQFEKKKKKNTQKAHFWGLVIFSKTRNLYVEVILKILKNN